MDFATAIGALSTSLTIVKQLRELDVSMNDAVYKAQLVALMEQLTDLKLQMIDAREEAKERDGEIARLKSFDSAALSDKLFVDGFYLDKKNDGTPGGVAYCQHCIETKKGLFHLHQLEKPGRPYGCTACRSEYRYVPDYGW